MGCNSFHVFRIWRTQNHEKKCFISLYNRIFNGSTTYGFTICSGAFFGTDAIEGEIFLQIKDFLGEKAAIQLLEMAIFLIISCN